MRVVVMEDYQRAVERLDAFALLAEHEVVVHSERPTTRRRAGGADRRCRGARPDPRADADRRAVARAPSRPEADLPDGARDAAHRRRGVHAPRHRRLHRRGLRLRAGGADARADPRLDALPRRRRRRAPRRARGRRRSGGSCTAARSGSSATGTSARSWRGYGRALGMRRASPGDVRARSSARRQTATRPSPISTRSASARTSSACT